MWCAAPSRQCTFSQVQHHTGLINLNYPAYSPDLAARDYHLFSNVKNFLRGKNFDSDNDRDSLFGES